MPSPSHILMLLDNPFGADARVEREVRTLVANGYKITLFALQNEELPQKESKAGATVYRILNPVIKSPLHRGYYGFVEKMAAQIAEMEPDFLHCHDHLCLALGSRVKQLKPKIKLVYDAHEYLAGWPLYKDIPSFLNRLKGRYVYKKMLANERAAIPFCDAVITVGELLSKEMNAKFRLQKDVVVVRNIPAAFASPRSDYFHKLFSLGPEVKILIHSGNIYHTRKRMQMLLDVVANFENLALVFIGDSHSVKSFQSRTKQQRVYFHDYPEEKEYWQLLGAANFGLVYTWKPEWISHWYSLPNRIFEYSLASLPVISTEQPEFKALGDTFGHLQLFRGDDGNSLHQAIENAMINEKTLRDKAAETPKILSWDLESKKLLNLYHTLKT